MVAPCDRPSGTMKVIAAHCTAIWCAAICTGPISPIRMTHAENRPISSTNEPPIGTPTCMFSRKRGQSATNRLWVARNRRTGLA
jgi:hypothetical protein